MPRCNDAWIRKGDTTVNVTVNPPTNTIFYVLQVLTYGRSKDVIVEPIFYDSAALAAGATWNVPANHRCTFTLLSTGDQALTTAIEIGGTAAKCTAGSHCQGQCQPQGTAGIAGYWTLTTWS